MPKTKLRKSLGRALDRLRLKSMKAHEEQRQPIQEQPMQAQPIQVQPIQEQPMQVQPIQVQTIQEQPTRMATISPTVPSLYDITSIMRLRQQEEAFMRDIERMGRGAGMMLGLRGLGASSVAAATARGIAESAATGLVNIRRQALLDALNMRMQALQQLGTILQGALSSLSAEGSLAAQAGLSGLSHAGAMYSGMSSTLAGAVSGIGALQGYQATPVEVTPPTVTPAPLEIPKVESVSGISIPTTTTKVTLEDWLQPVTVALGQEFPSPTEGTGRTWLPPYPPYLS